MSKTKWHTKAIYLIVALVMIASLMVPISNPLVKADPGAALKVDISAPTGGSYNVCDTFNVTFTVENTGDAMALNVSATIDPGEHAEVVYNSTGMGEGVSVPIDLIVSLGPGETRGPFNVLIHCTSRGDTTIEVMPGGYQENWKPITSLIADSVKVGQEGAWLSAGNISATPMTLTICQNATVVFNVTNYGEITAWDVHAFIDPDLRSEVNQNGPGKGVDIHVAASIAAGASHNATFILHCTGRGTSTVTIKPSGYEDSGKTIEIPSGDLVSDHFHVNQQGPELKVKITAPDMACPCNNFTALVNVGNSGETTAYDVLATISWTGPASSGLLTVDLGDIPDGDSKSFNWTAHCDEPGSVNITVTPSGWVDKKHKTPIPAEDLQANSAIVAQEAPVLGVELTAPYSWCTDNPEPFEVSANVTNSGNCSAYCVVATIDIAGEAALAPGEDPSHNLDTLSANSSQLESWLVLCNGKGKADITVTVNGFAADNCTLPVPQATAKVRVFQLAEEPALEAEIVVPETCQWFGISDTFPVKAVIHNTGCGDAYNVCAHIEINGPASLIAGESAQKCLGDVAPGAFSEHVSWTLHCDGEGEITITVVPTGKNADGSGIQPQLITIDKVYVHQQPLRVRVRVDKDEVCACETFNVTATVDNLSKAAATNVKATLKFTGPAELVSPPGATQDLDTIPGESSNSTAWKLHCTGYGPVNIGVEISGEIGGKQFSNKSSSVTVQQRVLIVDIQYPKEGDDFSTSENFWVNVNVRNCSNTTTHDVNAYIDTGTTASLIKGESYYKPLGDILAGEDQEVTWTLHCDSYGPSTIKVWAIGNWPITPEKTIEVRGEDEVTIDQYDKAHLVVNVSWYNPDQPDRWGYVWPCENFTVVARIDNYGEAAALNVTPRLTVEPASAATVLSGPTPPSANIGWWSSAYFYWELHCDEIGTANITVTATGIDEFTRQHILKDNIVPGSVEILQKPLRVEITAPDDGSSYNVCSEWLLYATFYNYYEGAVTNASATISVKGPAEVQLPPELTQSLPDIPADGSVALDLLKPWKPWHMHCYAEGDAHITVVVRGLVEGVGEVENEDTITVHQTEEPENPDLWVTITGPDPVPGDPTTTPQFCPCQDFELTFVIENLGLGDAENLQFTVDPGDYAEVDGNGQGNLWTSGDLGTLSYGGKYYGSVPMHCTSLGDTTIVVTPSSSSAGTTVHSDSLVVEQNDFVVNIEKPVTSTTFSTEQEFEVTATICNWNKAADDVVMDTLELSVSGNASIVSAPVMPPIIAFNTTETVTWTLRCDGPGDVTLQVHARGIREDTLTKEDWSKVITVHQELKAHLEADITVPDEPISKYEKFGWELTIYNRGQADALEVAGVVHVWEPGPKETKVPFNVKKILGGEHVHWTYKWTCNIPGPIKFLIEPEDIKANDENTGQSVLEKNKEGDEEVVYQEIPPGLVLHILEPKESTHVDCQDVFNVTAMLSNTGEVKAENVSVTLSIAGPAERVSPGATQYLPDMAGGTHKMDIVWWVRCYDEGDVTITVTGSGRDANTGGVVSAHAASTVVHQDLAPHLVVDIITPETSTKFSVCQDFDVLAKVTNIGCDCARDPYATISIDGSASVKPITDDVTKSVAWILRPGESEYVSWDLHCDGKGDVTITVTPTGGLCICDEIDGPCEEVLIPPIPAKHLVADSAVVHQQEKAHLVVEIDEPEDGDTIVACTTFNLTGVVKNIGEADALDVEAELMVRPDLSVRPTEGGYVLSLGTIPGGENATFTWNVHCKVACDSTIEVDASGKDKNTGSAILEDNIDSDSVTVKQILPAQLVVDINYPADGAQFNAGTSFVVTGLVSNIGENTAENVGVTLTVDANASITDAEKDLDDIAGGQSKIATWAVQCTTEGFSVFTATADGDNTAPALDKVTVKQGAPIKAHLVVEVTLPANGAVFEEGEQFPVTAKIKNIGAVTATGVTVAMYPLVNASVVSSPSGWPRPIGPNDEAIANWILRCDAAGFSVITVEALGTNSNTAMDSVTVKQIAPPEPYLTVSVSAPAEVNEGDTFVVTAVVTNIGDKDATVKTNGVVMTANGPASLTPQYANLPAMAAGDSVKFEFTLTCGGPGGVNVAVSAQGGNTNTAIDSVAVMQRALNKAYLTVDLSAPAEVIEGDSFVVTAVVTNIGDKNATAGTATMTANGPASPGTDSETLPAIAAGNSVKVEFTLTCEGAGGVNVAVEAQGGNTNKAIDSAAVMQIALNKAYLALDITYPENGDEFYGGDDPESFELTAVVTNIGELDYTGDIDVDLSAVGPVTPTSGSTTITGGLAAGESKVVTFTMTAGVTTGSAVITLTATGPNTALDVVTVKIDPEPTQVLYAGANPINYQGKTTSLPAALTNVSDKLEIIWLRDASTGGEWHKFYFYQGTPVGEITELVEGKAYIVVVTEDCTWKLPH